MDEPAGAVIAASSTGNGAFAVADPRPAGGTKKEGDHYETGGHFGVVPWTEPANVVSGNARHDNGFHNVADPRLPDVADRLVVRIIAPDNTWHRPFTTLELAGLQSLIDPDELFAEDSELNEWIRKMERRAYSDTSWREHIGNAVPPDAAQEMAGVIYRALLGAMVGETFTLNSAPVWVRPVAVALSVQPAGV
jgi:site-specific DNA-cytosine methylase